MSQKKIQSPDFGILKKNIYRNWAVLFKNQTIEWIVGKAKEISPKQIFLTAKVGFELRTKDIESNFVKSHNI